MSTEHLGPCPKCGKNEGELVDAGASRFRFFVTCKACGYTTATMRSPGMAERLWGLKPPGKSR